MDSKLAEAQKTIAENDGKALMKKAEAEKVAATFLQSKRNYDQKMRSLQVCFFFCLTFI